MIQGCRKQVERKEGYELQLVMVMATASQWHRATLALKKSTTGYVDVFNEKLPESTSVIDIVDRPDISKFPHQICGGSTLIVFAIAWSMRRKFSRRWPRGRAFASDEAPHN